MQPFLLGFCLGIATMVAVSAVLGAIMLLKARDADARGADRRRTAPWPPAAWRHTGF